MYIKLIYSNMSKTVTLLPLSTTYTPKASQDEPVSV